MTKKNLWCISSTDVSYLQLSWSVYYLCHPCQLGLKSVVKARSLDSVWGTLWQAQVLSENLRPAWKRSSKISTLTYSSGASAKTKMFCKINTRSSQMCQQITICRLSSFKEIYWASFWYRLQTDDTWCHICNADNCKHWTNIIHWKSNKII